MNRGRTITFKYKHFEYDDNIKSLLSVNLTSKDEQELKKIYNNYKALDIRRGYEYIIRDLYILIAKRCISTTDIANIYGVGTRTIQLWLKEIGLNRSQKEAQKIAVTKRDYKAIKQSFKKNMFNKVMDSQSVNSITGNNIKYKLNTLLIEKFSSYEVIVGISSLGITNEDTHIPVIIMSGSKINKFIIQILTPEIGQADQATRDKTMIINKNYKLLKLNTKDDSENGLIDIVNEIIKEVKGI